MPALAARSLPALVLVAAVLSAGAGCGRRGAPAGGAAPRLETPQAALGAALGAVAAGDWVALEAVLTEGGKRQVALDLAAWREALASPTVGPRTIARLPAPRDEAERAELASALQGDTAALLRTFARAAPRPPPSAATAPALTPDGAWAQAEYADAGGVLRRVLLVRTEAGWRVERLAL
jgi:hypothetical protein